MGKKITLKTTRQQLDIFISTTKTIRIRPEFKQRPRDKRYYEIKIDFIDIDDITIPNWSFKICVKQITIDDCQDSYGIYHQTNGKNESVVRLDVVHAEKIGHKEDDGTVFVGAHLHELNAVTSTKEELAFDCMNCENRKDWLNFFAKRFNITVKYDNSNNDLFGGWECSV